MLRRFLFVFIATAALLGIGSAASADNVCVYAKQISKVNRALVCVPISHLP